MAFAEGFIFCTGRRTGNTLLLLFFEPFSGDQNQWRRLTTEGAYTVLLWKDWGRDIKSPYGVL